MQNLKIKNNEVVENNKEKGFVANLSSKIIRNINKIMLKTLVFVSALLAGTPFESLADISSVNTDVDENTAIAGMANVFVKVAKYVGIVLIFGGIIGIVEAQMSDNPERKSTAAKALGVGVLLVGAEMVLKATGLVS